MTFSMLIEHEGTCTLPFEFDGQPDRRILLNCYRSPGYRPGGDVVLVQHGMKRNGDDYCGFWIDAANRHNLLIVAPTFSDAEFPGPQNYNDGMVLDADSQPISNASWIYHVPSRVVAALTEAGVMAEGKARIYGHSAGGQFLHRMVSLVGFGPFVSVIAANAGWYSLPKLEEKFPAGLGGIGLDENDLRSLLESELWILAGEKDCEANAENLPSNPEATAQGPGRLQRARNYVQAGRQAAQAIGCDFRWRIDEVPGIAHDGDAMGRAAAGLWFEGVMPSRAALMAGGGTFNA